MPGISFRQARIILAVGRSASITSAARAVNRSQSCVTKTIQNLEHVLDVALFDRSARGVSLTAYGNALFRGAGEAAQAFEKARDLVPPITARKSPGLARFYQMDISEKWLDAFLATAEHRSVAAAAQHLNVTPTAVATSLRKLEDSLDITLFERSPNSMMPISFSTALIRYIKLARSHLNHACDDLASLKGVRQGRVVVGSLPLVRTIVLPKAIARLRVLHPDIEISTMEGRYDELAAALRCGDIDLMVGALRGPECAGELLEETLFEDQLSIIVRSGHPLTTRKSIGFRQLLDFAWIMPRKGTPTRSRVETAMSIRGLPIPQYIVETSSLVVLRGLLMEGDYVTALSRQQVIFEETNGMLVVLPIDLAETSRPIGITRRASGTIPPAAELLMSQLRSVVGGARLPDNIGKGYANQAVPFVRTGVERPRIEPLRNVLS